MDSWSWKLKNCFYNLSLRLCYCALEVFVFYAFCSIFVGIFVCVCCLGFIWAITWIDSHRTAPLIIMLAQSISFYLLNTRNFIAIQGLLDEWQRVWSVGCACAVANANGYCASAIIIDHRLLSAAASKSLVCTIQIYAFNKQSRCWLLKFVVVFKFKIYSQNRVCCLYIRELVRQFVRYRSKIFHTSLSPQEAAHLSLPPISNHYSI